MIVAAYQMIAAAGDVAANVAAIEDAAERAAAQGARILVAPELATTGYGAGDAIRSLAEPVDGPQLSRLSAAAKRLGLAIVTGFAERNGGRLYNAAAFLSPAGWTKIHRKQFLYGDYEKALFAPADGLSEPFRFEDATIGMRVCFDVEFPEAVRPLALAGADLILAPTALPASPGSDFVARTLIPARAFENAVTLVYADHAGSDAAFCYAGQSVIALADGGEAARAPAEGEALLMAAIGPEAAARARAENDYIGELRARLES
ncbi:nitrilase-related carbon-nitrogen hydrolase [Hansschlegelia sp.]|uniref:nitrilase-related carbon-nitrogen hydrolase n=1 Tax=Hansschlegelia sp. TaxID=2041892 RepID=UPI002D05AF66|nr:nitrilase-related carbon-nitrogen hydrolase [Hansschlegelia sp.]HVI28732.1 nitrilase-related carbon-nitrogen hydrolase [Hansschlegelia sp.]